MPESHARTTVYPIQRPNGLAPRFERLRLMTAPVGSEGTPGPPAALPAPPATPPAPAAPPAPAPAAAPEASGWDGKVESLDPKVQKLITDLRTEAGNARVNAKETAAAEARDALAQDIGKALGLITDGGDVPDPAKLAEQIAAAQETARTAQVELAVHRAAPGLKADPGALLDSRTFLARVHDLDPTSADFAAKVGEAITSALTDNPKLAATVQVAGASSVDHAGGTGEGAITAERFAAMSPADKNDLFRKNPTLYRQLTGR